MRIYSLKDKEKPAFASVLPEGIGLGDALIIVSLDDERENAPVAGVMVLSSAASGIWRMDYLFVAESYRRRGVAKSLISYGRFLIQMMGASLLMTVILDDDKADTLEPLQECILNAGFSISSRQDICAVSIVALCDRLGPYVEHADLKQIIPLSKVNKAMWGEISASIEEMLHSEDLIVPIQEISSYNPSLSMVKMDMSGLCQGMVLISDIEGDLSVDYLWSSGSNGKITMSLLVAALKKVKTECDVLFDAQTRLGKRLAEKLLGEDIRLRYRTSVMTLSLE